MLRGVHSLLALTLFLTSAVLRVEAGWEDPSARNGEVKAKSLKDQFLTLSKDAMKMQCQQLEMARQRGQHKWMEAQAAHDERVAQLCARILGKGLKVVSRGASQEEGKEPAPTSVVANIAHKAMAHGCTALLRAQNNGKMEWFESQGWYKRAMLMCTDIAKRGPMVQAVEAGQEEQAIGFLKNLAAVPLLKHTCDQLSQVPEGSPIHTAEWFGHATRLCATVQSSNPNDLRMLVRHQEHLAESASGQLVKQTCEKMWSHRRAGGMKIFQHEPWYLAISAMCSKLGTKRVHGNQLMQKCQWLQKIKDAGREEAFRQAPWFPRLKAGCEWLKKNQKREWLQQHSKAAGSVLV